MNLFLCIVLAGVLAAAGYLYTRFLYLPPIVRFLAVPWQRRVAAGALAGGLMIVSLMRANMVSVFFLYLFLGYLLFDLLLLLFRKSGFLRKIYLGGLSAWILAALVVPGGYIAARTMVVNEYRVAIDKELTAPLRILFVSDLHLGAGTGPRELDRFRRIADEIKPDLIALVGDIYDERTPRATAEYSFLTWEKLSSRYGTFYVTGNHEHGSHGSGVNVPELLKTLEAHNVTPLADRGLLIDNRFYLFGRIDKRVEKTSGIPRPELAQLLAAVDGKLPLIVLDHQPFVLIPEERERVDLQLSGHTHAGQLFPINFLVKFFYEKSYGLLKKDGYHMIVSSGLGSWGFPLRTSNFAEIVLVTVTGKR